LASLVPLRDEGEGGSSDRDKKYRPVKVAKFKQADAAENQNY
jgi:hypothetical protein